ncbi:MAG: class I SAM-dependent rRNA methyltransferase [Lentisphaeria bacterium]
MPVITLKAGREKSLIRLHPWIFSGAIDRIEGDPDAGAVVDVHTGDGVLIGRGGYSPASQITVRMWSFTPEDTIDREFLQKRISTAISFRSALPALPMAACRLINAESDGMPGLIVDRYGEFLVCQFLTCAVEAFKQEIVELLQELTGCQGIYERSDVSVRNKENLPPTAGVLAGSEPPELISITEHERQYHVDIRTGHKTGFYLDQRDNRTYLAARAEGKSVLNCFSYTGGFAIAALTGGAADVTNIDTSATVLELGRRNVELNKLPSDRVTDVEGDVFEVLRRYRDSRRSFDVIVLDPPRFAESKMRLPQASRGYKDINLLALKLLRPGGLLLTYSCSGHVAPDLFQKIVSDAALDADRVVQIIDRHAQPGDHPIALTFPEAQYLKGLVCRAQ